MKQFEEADAVPASDIKRRATLEGIAWRAIERAKRRVGIRARRENVPGEHGVGRWMWAAPSLGRQGRDEEEGEQAKTAEQIPLAALGRCDSDDAPNSVADANLGAKPKTAKPKTAKPQLAALRGDAEERAENPVDGVDHA